MYKCFFKRLFDLILSGIALIVLSPIYIVLYVLVRHYMGSPVLFKQERVGKNKKKFYLMKFRTMTDARDADGNLLPDSERLSRFGAWLRNSSLDELPEIVNIFKGDMSIIGPRPLYERYNPFFTEKELDRFRVRGGLIPPETLYGNPNPTWDEQLGYEGEYGRNVCFFTDLKILIKVFQILIRRNKTEYGSTERNSLDVERKKY